MRILALCGSLSNGSTNSALLDLLATRSSPHVVVRGPSLDTLPYFSADDDEALPIANVVALKDQVRDVDAVLIATPEYAGGMPGVLKNALDWLVGGGELYEKPVVVISAAPSENRGSGARAWLEQTLRMQGARVCDSFTVAITRGASPTDLGAQADVAWQRTERALRSCSGGGQLLEQRASAVT